jgi:hypothetical protein
MVSYPKSCPHCFLRFRSVADLSRHLVDDGDQGSRCPKLSPKRAILSDQDASEREA